MNRQLLLTVSLLCSPLLLFSQLPVFDGANEVQLIKEGIQMGTQILVSRNTLSTLTAQQQWLAQVVLSKLPWGVQVPAGPQNSIAANQIGEMIAWTPALATGQGSGTAWRNAAVQLANLAPLLANQGLGSAPIGQLATVEAINAAGANNLAIIGEARSYLNTNLPAMQGLQNQILSPDPAQNGPTQQMQYAALGTAQNGATAVQTLQVNTGTLEAVTAIAKGVSDAGTADLNLQAKQQETYLTQSTGVGGFGQAFASAGVTCNVGCP